MTEADEKKLRKAILKLELHMVDAPPPEQMPLADLASASDAAIGRHVGGRSVTWAAAAAP